MGRYICSHSHRDTGSTVYQKIRISSRKHGRLFFGLIKIRDKINRILGDIRKHFHGYFRKPCLGISHGRRSVAVNRAEISMSVHKHISHGPVLCHINQCPVNGAVAVRMIFTHRITDDTRTFSVGLVGPVIQLDHRIKDTSLNRLEAIPYVRKSPGSDNAHGIIDIGALHGLFQIDLMDIVNQHIIHILTIPFIYQDF